MLSCHKLHGKFSKKIFVDTNDPSNPQATLVCNGQLLEAVKLNPQVANFGRVYLKEGVVHEKKVVVTRGDAGPLAPELAPVKDEDITAELRTVEEGEKYELIVTGHPKANSNRLHGRITLRTGIKEEPSVNINVFGTVVPRVSYRPIAFTVPSTADVKWKQTVELFWNDGKAPQLLEAKTNNEKLAASVRNNGMKRFVELSLIASLAETGLPADVEVTVTTDDAKSPELTIPVRYQRGRPPVRPKRPAVSQRRVTPKRTPPAKTPQQSGADNASSGDGAASDEKAPANADPQSDKASGANASGSAPPE